MALQHLYEAFLARPEPEMLAADCSLHYITTTTTHTQPENIVKHLQVLERSVHKQAEKTLNVVEGPNSLCLDVETKLLFVSGGGPYLLSLDDNFLVDRTVTIPMIHIVHFDADNKIVQIRQYWEQASLLKQLSIIGPRNNWPILDSVDQTRLINSSIAAAARSASRAVPSAPQPKKPTETTPKKNAKDPHASLSLFGAQTVPDEPQPSTQSRPSTGSAKPPPREYNDLFQADEAVLTPPKSSTPSVMETPKTVSKTYTHFEFGEAKVPQPHLNAPKPQGHFEFGEADLKTLGQPKKANSNRPAPFEFGEADPSTRPQPAKAKSNRHMSQWDFEDFVTPERPKQRTLGQNVRHFGWSDDEVDQLETPKPKARVVNPRRDAETHFKLQDEVTPVAKKKTTGREAGVAHNNGLRLYENNLYDEEGKRSEPLTTHGSIAGKEDPRRKKIFDRNWEMTDDAENQKEELVHLDNDAGRRKVFGRQWEMTDETPQENVDSAAAEPRPVSSNRMKAVKSMDSSWNKFDESPARQKSAAVPLRANPNRRSAYQKTWGFGDED